MVLSILFICENRSAVLGVHHMIYLIQTVSFFALSNAKRQVIILLNAQREAF